MRHVILNFHGLGTPPLPEREPGEHRYWIGTEMFDAVLAQVAAVADRVSVTLTFDDGNLSDLQIGAEALARQGLHATFFVLADRVGQPHSLSEVDIRALQAAGHAIGSHGAAHVDWTALDAAGQGREFGMARDRIAQITGTSVGQSAIPFGRYNASVLKGLRGVGFKAAYSSDGGVVTGPTWPLPRTSLRADMGVADVAALLQGPDPLVRRARRGLGRLRKRWL